MERILEVDSRRRVALGQLGNKGDTRYLAHDTPDGSIVLQPVAVVPASQARFMTNPARVAQLDRAIRETDQAVPAPSWLLDDLDEADGET